MTAWDCEKIREFIPLYIEQELSAKETEFIQKHLENCEECQKEYAFFASVLKNLSSMPEPELPKDFHVNLMRKVRAAAPAKKTYYFDFKRIAGFAAAAAVITLSVVSFMNLEKTKEQNANPDVYLTAPAQQEKTEKQQQAETQDKSAVEEKNVPRITSHPKTSIGGKEAQNETSGFSRVREVPESAISETQAESSAAPAMEQSEQIAAHSEEEIFICATVSVAEPEKPTAESILSGFTKGDQGYLVGENLELVLEKLSELDGYVVEKTQNENLTEHIIILK